MLLYIFAAFLIHLQCGNSFVNPLFTSWGRKVATLSRDVDVSLYMAKKYDPSTFIKVEIKKPMGISLEEVSATEKRGVYVLEVKDGNAKQTNKVFKGQLLIEVNGEDVRYKSFDEVMDSLSTSQGESVNLVFVDPRSVYKGSATVTVKMPNGETKVVINTLKGTLLRPLLLDANVDLYAGATKLTNCGGGGSCGTCVVSVVDNEDWEKRPDFEAKKLKKYDTTARLSCNTVIEGDATVVIAPLKVN